MKGLFELKGWMANVTLWGGTFSFAVAVWGVLSGAVRWEWLGLTFVAHLVLALCISMVLHRYLTHRAFEVRPAAQYVLSFMSILPLMLSPLYWAPMHIDHHAFSDTDRDPNVTDKKYLLWRYSNGVGTKPKMGVMRHLMSVRGLMFCHKYTLALAAGLALALALIHPLALLYGYMAPLGIAAWGQGLHQVFAHKDGQPVDRPWLEVLWSTGGEWMHKYHHDKPSAAAYGGLDISYWVIKLIAVPGSIR